MLEICIFVWAAIPQSQAPSCKISHIFFHNARTVMTQGEALKKRILKSCLWSLAEQALVSRQVSISNK